MDSTDNFEEDYEDMPKESNEVSSFSFTQDQHKALLALLQQSASQNLHSTNQVTTLTSHSKPSNPSGISYALSFLSRLSQWILDTGATDHVYFSLSRFQWFRKIKPIFVRLPNGNTVSAQVEQFSFPNISI